jgi:hypothetical protein
VFEPKIVMTNGKPLRYSPENSVLVARNSYDTPIYRTNKGNWFILEEETEEIIPQDIPDVIQFLETSVERHFPMYQELWHLFPELLPYMVEDA